MLIAHTLSIRKFAVLGGISFGVYLLLSTFLFSTWTYEIRYVLGLVGFQEQNFFMLLGSTSVRLNHNDKFGVF